MVNENILYSIRDLIVEYHTRSGVLRAVDQVSFDIQRGEVLGLVGESGCGKSTLGKATMRMIQEPGKIIGGELWFEDRDLLTISDEEMRQLRGDRISMIFQDPMTSLNPVQRIVDHIIETIRTHDKSISEKAARDRASQLIDRLGIRQERLDDYPHQLSGGMRQRVMISLALALRADLVIADEATTSLDVIVEAQFLDLLRELREEFDLTIILITHNIGVVAELSDRVAVMYAGRLAELSGIHEIFSEPLHPYTDGLLKSVPNIKLLDDELYKMGGAPPNLASPPDGCRFHPRCPRVMDICSQVSPSFQDIDGGQFTACWLYEEHHELQGRLS
jgi:oligopeptide/dipeptide ABC transporter ATP-binding protein